MRAAYDAHGAWHKLLVAVVDGSFCNRAVCRAVLERVAVVARCRNDARLCRPAAPGSRRRYDATTFTPAEVRTDPAIPVKTATMYYGGAWRQLRYKEMTPLYWRNGAGTRPLRLIVVMGVPSRCTRHGETHYREPADLLTTGLTTPAE